MSPKSIAPAGTATIGTEDNPFKYGYGVRHVQLGLFLLCLTVNIIGRTHMGVTIVAMTIDPKMNTTLAMNIPKNDTGILNYVENQTENTNASFSLATSEENVMSLNITQDYKMWIWPKFVQEIVLNAFFLGYMIMMFPMGLLCQRYGGKLPLQIGLFVNGIVSIATPWLTVWGDWKALCCCRILQGLSQAGTYPSIQSILGKWVPANERATLGCCVHTGLTIGTVVAFQLAGLLGASKWGWPSTFYVIGIIFLLCFILITIYGAANPLEHKSVSEKERNYIMGSINDGNDKILKTPWRAIFTSKPLWGAMTAHTGSNIISIFFFNQMGTYLHYILNIDVKNSGLLSSLPYVAGFFTMILFGWLSDYGTNNKIVSKNNARRISNSMAAEHCFPKYKPSLVWASVAAFLVKYINTMLVLEQTLNINYIDLAPDFSGTLTAIGNTLANIVNLLMPGIISYVVTDVANIMQWRLMFFITAGVALFANTVFVLLVSTDVQSWNNGNRKESGDEDKKEETKETEENVTLRY